MQCLFIGIQLCKLRLRPDLRGAANLTGSSVYANPKESESMLELQPWGPARSHHPAIHEHML